MKYWLRYSKMGLMRYIGHLDVLHHWERVLRRAKLPLAFSQGFSPHPLLSLAAPLPVGQTSQAEYLELELATPLERAELLQAVQAQLPPGLVAQAVAPVPAGTKPLMGLVRFADYQLTGAALAEVEPRLSDFLQAENCLLSVTRKGGVKSVDIRPLVRSASLTTDGQLLVCLATGSTANLRPDDLLRALHVADSVAVLRLELYLQPAEQLLTPWQFLSEA